MATKVPIRRKATAETWWLAETDAELGRLVTQRATAIETATIGRRWRSLIFYRHTYNRPYVAQFAYGMARRPSGFVDHYSGFNFKPASYSLIQVAGRVYENRLFRQNVVLSVIPDRGDYKQRQLSEDMESWLDASDEDLNFSETWQQHLIFARDYGTGFLKTFVSGRGRDKAIGNEAVHPDELLPDNPDDPFPDHLIQRVWGSRSALLAEHGDDPAAVSAIEKAPSAYPCFYQGALEVKDVIPLIECWKRGDNEAHALIVGNYCLYRRKYSDDYDDGGSGLIGGLTRTKFFDMAGFYGMGLAETLLAINESIDEHFDQISLAHRQLAFAKWMVEAGSAVNPDALGDNMGAIVTYTGVAPKLEAPPTVNEEFYQHLKDLIMWGMQLAQLSLNAIQGELPKALTSAVALEKYANISDANLAILGERIERSRVDAGYQRLRAAKVVEPSYKIPGRDKELIDWGDIKYVAGRPAGLKAYGVNRLSQDPAGRQQQIEDSLAKGLITRRIYAAFTQIPDVNGMLDAVNVKQSSLQKRLDGIVKTGKYRAPSQFMDLDMAKEQVEDRILLEENYDTPANVLNALRMFRGAVVQLIKKRDSAAQAPGAPAAPGPAPFTGSQFPTSIPNPVPLPGGLPGKPLPIQPQPTQ